MILKVASFISPFLQVHVSWCCKLVVCWLQLTANVQAVQPSEKGTSPKELETISEGISPRIAAFRP